MNTPTTLIAILADLGTTAAQASDQQSTLDISKARYDQALAAAQGDNLTIVDGGFDVALLGFWFHIHARTISRSRQRGGDITRYILQAH